MTADLTLRNNVIIPQWARLTTNALEIEGVPTIDEAEGLAYVFSVIDDKSNWYKGDLMLFCERKFGQDAFQIVPESIYADHHKLWQKSRWICDRIPQNRRRTELTFSHHELVAKLDEATQEEWLELAVKEQMTVSDLRKAIRGEPEEKLSCAERYEYLADVSRRVAKNMPDGQDKDDLLEALNRE